MRLILPLKYIANEITATRPILYEAHEFDRVKYEGCGYYFAFKRLILHFAVLLPSAIWNKRQVMSLSHY